MANIPLSFYTTMRLSFMKNLKVVGKVQTAGRLQIPKDIRKKLVIKDGDTLVFEISDVIHSPEEVSA
jgi:AbrB family looped-hinge helix DNA binding protein